MKKMFLIALCLVLIIFTACENTGQKRETINLTKQNTTANLTTNEVYSSKTVLATDKNTTSTVSTSAASKVLTSKSQINDDVIYFKDEVFEKAVRNEINKNNGTIKKSDVAKIKVLDMEDVDCYTMYDLSGIEFFTNLEELNCSYQRLKELDLSKNTKLEVLKCSYNKLTELDLSKNTKLWSLDCLKNDLTKLDLSKNIKLLFLNCRKNDLTKLDLSKNTKLDQLDCSKNDLTKLDLSKNTKLWSLKCSDNKLTELNLGKKSKLESLECTNNNLFTLDISKAYILCSLDCRYNKFHDKSAIIGLDLDVDFYPQKIIE